MARRAGPAAARGPAAPAGLVVPGGTAGLTAPARGDGAGGPGRAGIASLPGGGAAGGLAGGLAALGAPLRSGFEVIAGAVGLRDAIAAADLVITGEGALDATSLDGKVVGGVLALARGKRRAVIAGHVAPGLAIDSSVTVRSLTALAGSP